MFPDPTLKWKPLPSVIDGMPLPSADAHGIGPEGLCLTVHSFRDDQRAFGIELQCQAYFAMDDLLYKYSNHGEPTSDYGDVYIMEATASALLDAQARCNPTIPVRHFRFTGFDFCYEVLSVDEPKIHTFANDDEAYAWAAKQTR